MRLFLFILLVVPVLAFAQNAAKTKPVVNEGFEIIGEITGFPDNTSVSFMNGQTGAVESETKIVKNKFIVKGKMESPEFKVLMFNKQQPYVILFLDNSKVFIKGTKETLNDLAISGSATQKDFIQFTKEVKPYETVFAENAVYDSAANSNAAKICYNFSQKNKSSYVAPLAVFRYYQATMDIAKTENIFNALAPKVKSSTLGTTVAKLIDDTKKNGAGGMLSNFTQTDTAGVPVSLSSLRGKYVLVDFWASWCRPCRQENPNVVAAYNKFKDKNFTVLGVSLDQNKAAWISAIAMDGLTWTHVSDLKGWGNAVAAQNNITSIPQNILIGPDGKIIARNLRGPVLEMKLSQILR